MGEGLEIEHSRHAQEGPRLNDPAVSPAVNLPALTAVVFLGAFVLVFAALAVGRKFNVDENVFIASGALLSRRFVLPYRDYHYNHMPTLVILYALLFRLTGHLLLIARTFSALCAAGAVAVLFHIAYKSFIYLSGRQRLIFAVGIALLLMADPMFNRTAARAWNHDFPVLASLLGFLAMNRGLRDRRTWLVALSGAALALAFTSRLTFATMLLPFGVFILIYPGLTIRRRATLCAAFATGCLVASLPSAWVWAQSPRNAYFGNFQYPALNTRYHAENDIAAHHRYSLPAKLWFFFSKLYELPANGIVSIAFVVLIVSTVRWAKVTRDPFHCELGVLALLVASQVAAGMAPAPSFIQYFYAATPFMVLGAALCLAARPNLGGDVSLHRFLGGCLILCLAFAIPEYRNAVKLGRVRKWIPNEIHRTGVEVVRQAGPGRIFTLEPVFPLEGGADIDEALGTGRFGMRVGDYLTPEQRARFRMYGTADIGPLFDKNPPHALLATGSDDGVGLEKMFEEHAKDHGYRSVQIPSAGKLWVAPR